MEEWLCTVEGPGGQSITRNFLVDTGASLSLIPVGEARSLGLPVVGYQAVMTAGKVLDHCPVVRAKVSVEGCGYFMTEFYAVPTTIYCLGMSAIRVCGLRIPGRRG